MDQFFTEHNVNSLLRADIETRFKVYKVAVQNGILNPNEIRSLENQNPYDGGDEYHFVADQDNTMEEPREEGDNNAT